MLVKNFLLLSALAVAVVSAADKQTSLRHKEAGRGLKKEDKKKKDKKENEGGGTDFDIAANKFGACTTQGFRLDFTNYANGGTFNKYSGGIPGFGMTLANGQFSMGSCDTIMVDEGQEADTIEVNRVEMNEACAEDEKCCSRHAECDSGCCAGWMGCVPEGTAAYTKLCGGR